ncbi:hypothetical protein [Paenibacillus cymbidii]|uniref:hypothetical protein n=1 Tax=Paenibacillus cymbidii TaxID=1639034 RepID=UPI001080395C|nr:hypothetical protein [Paenibacillus cymbidii]
MKQPRIEPKKESIFTRMWRRIVPSKKQAAPAARKLPKGRFGRQVLRNQVRRQKAYKPGTIGLSQVAEAIKRDYFGRIHSRSLRKHIAKMAQKPRKIYLAGER